MPYFFYLVSSRKNLEIQIQFFGWLVSLFYNAFYLLLMFSIKNPMFVSEESQLSNSWYFFLIIPSTGILLSLLSVLRLVIQLPRRSEESNSATY